MLAVGVLEAETEEMCWEQLRNSYFWFSSGTLVYETLPMSQGWNRMSWFCSSSSGGLLTTTPCSRLSTTFSVLLLSALWPCNSPEYIFPPFWECPIAWETLLAVVYSEVLSRKQMFFPVAKVVSSGLVFLSWLEQSHTLSLHYVHISCP